MICISGGRPFMAADCGRQTKCKNSRINKKKEKNLVIRFNSKDDRKELLS